MPDEEHKESRQTNYDAEARNDFDVAFMKGFWHEVLSWFLQRKNT